MNQQTPILADEDLLYTILADLKRSCREYTTATTESNCPSVRQHFLSLTQSSLDLQGKLYNFMSQQGMYSTSSPTLENDITKQITEYGQTQIQTNQLIQQNLGH
ncbi:spore coat protein [Bacillus massiliigorillae]|uniref:spore coat protein n=1 Tax=Bacillus massiliigorillae TaxID=1243664 RepID=UPI0003A5C2EB|nr:spore coat protein [Bacillus massiliigorillae]